MLQFEALQLILLGLAVALLSEQSFKTLGVIRRGHPLTLILKHQLTLLVTLQDLLLLALLPVQLLPRFPLGGCGLWGLPFGIAPLHSFQFLPIGLIQLMQLQPVA
ncbi:MAG: hypothetical protein PVG20_09175 [Thioalkalispiraceae bacterium]